MDEFPAALTAAPICSGDENVISSPVFGSDMDISLPNSGLYFEGFSPKESHISSDRVKSLSWKVDS